MKVLSDTQPTDLLTKQSMYNRVQYSYTMLKGLKPTVNHFSKAHPIPFNLL